MNIMFALTKRKVRLLKFIDYIPDYVPFDIVEFVFTLLLDNFSRNSCITSLGYSELIHDSRQHFEGKAFRVSLNAQELYGQVGGNVLDVFTDVTLRWNPFIFKLY